MQKIKIVSEPSSENPFLIIYKPQGLPSAPILTNETDTALNQAMELFPEIKKVNGRKQIEYGLLHRIDTQTEGLLLIATSQFFYDELLKEQVSGNFTKKYIANCISLQNTQENQNDGYPVFTEENKSNFYDRLFLGNTVRITSFFRNYGEGLKSVRPVTEFSGKAALKKVGKKTEYSTDIKLVKKENEIFTFECSIATGYRHQVRCHLAWAGFPIIGDKIYNPFVFQTSPEKMQFVASELTFINPITQKKVNFSINKAL